MTRWCWVLLLAAGLASGCERRVSADRAIDPAAASAPAAAVTSRSVTIPAGTSIHVRLASSLSSKGSQVEDPVDATLVSPLVVRGEDALPAGSHVKGDVVSVQPSGKVKGRAHLAVRFHTLVLPDGSVYKINARVSRIAPATKERDAATIGLPAAGGAIVGALVGGGKGAAAGAAIGGGAGTAVVLATPGKEVSLPRGAVVSLRLEDAVTVRATRLPE
jgi:hypothetical protein